MRIFIALSLPKFAVNMLCEVQKKLASSGIVGRPVERQNLHLTLRFIGEVDKEMVKKICDVTQSALENTQAPLVCVDGLNAFIRSGGDTVYAKIGGDVEKVQNIEKTLTKALITIGIQPEIRPFTPHITLLRSANLGNKRFSVHSDSFYLNNISVYSSILGSRAPIYEKIHEVILS